VPDWIDEIRGELDRVIAEGPKRDEALAVRRSMAEPAPASERRSANLKRGRSFGANQQWLVGKPSSKGLSV
jgi:hypothetical protein